jgi:hypothetical protein
VYALVIDQNGPKLRESPLDAPGILRMNGGGRTSGSGATVTRSVNWFSNANGVDRPVTNQTGLTGRYDFTLEWSNPLAGQADSRAPSIFTAMPEQLGTTAGAAASTGGVSGDRSRGNAERELNRPSRNSAVFSQVDGLSLMVPGATLARRRKPNGGMRVLGQSGRSNVA